MRKQKKTLREQYYTDSRVAKKLIDYFNEKVGFDKFKIIIEPSAGNGSFFNNIPRNKHRKVVGMDIYPKHKKIKKQNFLTWKFPYNTPPDKVLCIGNPPFGLQSSLAKRFLDKCSQFSDHIAFILPLSFNTLAFKKSIPKGFRKQWSINLDENIFVDTKGHKFSQPLKTMFIYYKYDKLKQRVTKQLEPNGLWEFKRKTSSKERANADFRVIRASGTPGRAIHKHEPNFAISGNTYNDYYIRLLRPIRSYVKDIIYDINTFQIKKKWKFNNTTTFKSIDKQQMIKVLNKITDEYY